VISKTLGHYQIIGQIGKGGMGEVYLAEDLSLNRKVALKFLSEIFAGDPERLARFEREAKVLASLNHPNIAVIYGLEQAESKRFLVLELVEGETVAQRISRGLLPIEEALEICRQIAEALEAAHEKGVIHRDLKPANVMITSGDKVKILDFGLAKALSDEGQNADSSQLSTLTEVMTRPGVILGTAAYMSPEQAKGKNVDKRADIWALGCILYECLTGKRAFEGEAVTETLAAVLKGEPNWQALPDTTPEGIRILLQRCLQKDPKQRFRDAADVGIEIKDARSSPVRSGAPAKALSSWKVLAFIMVALILGAAIGAAALWSLRSPAPAKIARFSFVLPEDQSFSAIYRRVLAISPNGKNLVYVANSQLYLKRLSEMESRPIPGTQGGLSSPFFSPDGEWVGYFSGGALKKIPLTGGVAVTLCKASNPYGASWQGDTIVFGQGSNGILTVSAEGGAPEVLVKMEPGEVADSPQMLPSGDVVLFAVARSAAQNAAGGQVSSAWDKADVVVYSRKNGNRKTLFQGGGSPRYVATGHIIYALGNNVMMVPFDSARLVVTGGPVAIMEGVARAGGVQDGGVLEGLARLANTAQNVPGAANFDISGDGTLAYIPSGIGSGETGRRVLALVDRNGKREVLGLPPGSYKYPRLSPDGKQLAVVTDDGGGTIWIYEMSGNSALRRLTFGGTNSHPVWSPDGKRLAFYSDRENKPGIFLQAADGTGAAERLTDLSAADAYVPSSWSPDGKTLAFAVGKGGNYHIWTVTLMGERKARQFADLPSSTEANASFSPDGRWLAYTATYGSGKYQIFVQPFPETGAAAYQISREATNDVPAWSPDGKELYFCPLALKKLVAVPIRTQPAFSFGQPVELAIEGIIQPVGGRSYDITPNGKFLVVLPETQAKEQARQILQVNFVLNWLEELKQRMPVK
jgi:serine/threonine protein kinase